MDDDFISCQLEFARDAQGLVAAVAKQAGMALGGGFGMDSSPACGIGLAYAWSRKASSRSSGGRHLGEFGDLDAHVASPEVLHAAQSQKVTSLIRQSVEDGAFA